jgi:hypothetical protein
VLARVAPGAGRSATECRQTSAAPSASLSPTWRGRARRRLLQLARHVRAAHQGRQERDHMDPTVMPDLHRNAVRLQLHALAYNLGNFMRTLAIPKAVESWSLTQPAREADQDRREGRSPRPLRHVPNGRSRSLPADVCRHPVADRPAAGPTCAGMTRARVQMRRTARGEVCADLGKRGAFCVSVRLTAALIVLCLWRRRFAVCSSRSEARSWPQNSRYLANGR